MAAVFGRAAFGSSNLVAWAKAAPMAADPTWPAQPSRITYDDFTRVDIRVGTVRRAEPYPEARKPALKLWIDFGEMLGEKTSSAQITHHYTPDSLVGRQVAAVVNFPSRRIGRFVSEVLVLGFPDAEGNVVLVSPDRPVPNGTAAGCSEPLAKPRTRPAAHIGRRTRTRNPPHGESAR